MQCDSCSFNKGQLNVQKLTFCESLEPTDVFLQNFIIMAVCDSVNAHSCAVSECRVCEKDVEY